MMPGTKGMADQSCPLSLAQASRTTHLHPILSQDLAMCWYCAERDTYICAAARSTNIIENLGSGHDVGFGCWCGKQLWWLGEQQDKILPPGPQ